MNFMNTKVLRNWGFNYLYTNHNTIEKEIASTISTLFNILLFFIYLVSIKTTNKPVNPSNIRAAKEITSQPL